MKKALLVLVILAAAVLLSGCVVISFEESGRTRRFYAICMPAQGAIRVVHVPSPQPRPHQTYLLE